VLADSRAYWLLWAWEFPLQFAVKPLHGFFFGALEVLPLAAGSVLHEGFIVPWWFAGEPVCAVPCAPCAVHARLSAPLSPSASLTLCSLPLLLLLLLLLLLAPPASAQTTHTGFISALMMIPWRPPTLSLSDYYSSPPPLPITPSDPIDSSVLSQFQAHNFAQTKSFPELDWAYVAFHDGSFTGYSNHNSSNFSPQLSVREDGDLNFYAADPRTGVASSTVSSSSQDFDPRTRPWYLSSSNLPPTPNATSDVPGVWSVRSTLTPVARTSPT
jgi:hypothetical protein